MLHVCVQHHLCKRACGALYDYGATIEFSTGRVHGEGYRLVSPRVTLKAFSVRDPSRKRVWSTTTTAVVSLDVRSWTLDGPVAHYVVGNAVVSPDIFLYFRAGRGGRKPKGFHPGRANGGGDGATGQSMAFVKSVLPCELQTVRRVRKTVYYRYYWACTVVGQYRSSVDATINIQNPAPGPRPPPVFSAFVVPPAAAAGARILHQRDADVFRRNPIVRRNRVNSNICGRTHCDKRPISTSERTETIVGASAAIFEKAVRLSNYSFYLRVVVRVWRSHCCNAIPSG